MTEADIQRDITAYLENKDYRVIRHNAGKARNNVRMSPKGFPDLQAIGKKGFTFFIEVKKPGGELRPEQAMWAHELGKRGFLCVCVSSVWEIEKLLGEKIMKATELLEHLKNIQKHSQFLVDVKELYERHSDNEGHLKSDLSDVSCCFCSSSESFLLPYLEDALRRAEADAKDWLKKNDCEVETTPLLIEEARKTPF